MIMKKVDNQDSIQRVANLIVNRKPKAHTICITGMSSVSGLDKICEMIVAELKKMEKNTVLIEAGWKEEHINLVNILEKAKKESDYVIVKTVSVAEKAVGVNVASACDTSVLVIEKNKVEGNRAMYLRRELDMNGVNILGAIFIK